MVKQARPKSGRSVTPAKDKKLTKKIQKSLQTSLTSLY